MALRQLLGLEKSERLIEEGALVLENGPMTGVRENAQLCER